MAEITVYQHSFKFWPVVLVNNAAILYFHYCQKTPHQEPLGPNLNKQPLDSTLVHNAGATIDKKIKGKSHLNK
jgi:hypothetical protein